MSGDPKSLPSVAPPRVFARQISVEPNRIEMGWEPLRCLQQNSPITNYVVEYGRTDTSELRQVTTSQRYIYSQTSNTNDGLGFLKLGEEYWFRVAAVNANGQGPFSPIRRATPMALPSGNYHYDYMILSNNQ